MTICTFLTIHGKLISKKFKSALSVSTGASMGWVSHVLKINAVGLQMPTLKKSYLPSYDKM
jgi:hypothetical protein